SSRPRRQRLRRRRLSNALSPASQVGPTGPRIRTATSRSSRIRNTTTRAISAVIASPASHEGEEAYPNNAVTLPLPTTPEEELEAAIEALLRGVDACLRGGTALLSVTRPAEAIREAFAKWKEAR